MTHSVQQIKALSYLTTIIFLLPHLKALNVKLDYVLICFVPQINSKLYSMFLIIPVVVVVAMALEETPWSVQSVLESEDQIRSP